MTPDAKPGPRSLPELSSPLWRWRRTRGTARLVPGEPLRCVLIIAGEIEFSSRLASSLGRNRYLVLVAHDAPSAVRLTEKRKPDAIVLDVHLPRRGGPFLYRWLKSHATFRGIPVVAVTAPPSKHPDTRASLDALVQGLPIPPPERVLDKSADDLALLKAVDGTINPEVSVFQ